MPHAHTAHLLDEWRRRRPAGGRLPERTALSPLLFGALLPQMFVLAEVGGVWRFRTAGALVEDLHGRALAGAAFAEIWAAEDRGSVATALESARHMGRPRILACRGATARGRTAVLEVTIAPVTGPLGRPDRCLGLHQPLTPLTRLEGEPLVAVHLDAPASASIGPRLVVDNTRSGPLGSAQADVAER